MNTWKPIETAPKDGTIFLGLIPKGKYGLGIYVLTFRGKTFRYAQTVSRIFEAWRYLKYWTELPEPPEALT